ncbi:MAG: hypothetical protein QOF09_3892 [Alphaproteobacteria bacterium]|nr:hypothetical protein [Alphaproteobacteria bacterium]
MDSSPDFSVVTVIFLAATFAAALVAGLAGKPDDQCRGL